MDRLISVVLINVPIVALLSTLAASTTTPITFYAAIFYAFIVGLSGLMSLNNNEG